MEGSGGLIKAGIRVAVPLLMLLLSVSHAHALYSYSDVVSTLEELCASASSPGGPQMRVVQIGTTLKGKPILMAVLSAEPVEAPESSGDVEEPAEDPAATAPEPGVDAPESDATEPASNVLTLTLDPVDEAPAPVEAAMAAPAMEEARPRRVFILCRQHGNEPASTEGVMRFLKEYATTEDPAKLEILRRVTFLVVPMLNVDGVEKDQRRNARNVDRNRDWLSQSQPETRAIVQAVRKWRPDLLMDLHELHPTDQTPSFVEAMEPEAGARGGVGAACNAAIAAVVGPLREQSIRIYARPVINYRETRLAHRYFSVKEGVPAILVETRRAWGLALEHRTVVHYAAIVAAARYMAGYELTTPSRVIAEWLEPSANTAYRTAVAKRSGSGDDGKIAEAIANRQKAQLASRKGKPASVDKKRAELIKKRAAQQKKKTRTKKK